MTFDRIVVGAGIAGLLAAKRAVERGESVLVLEQSDHSGGAVTSTTIAGFTIDAGAESFSIADAHVEQLIEELNLGPQMAEPSELSPWIISSAERYKIPQGFFGIPMSLDDSELEKIVGSAAINEARNLDARPLGELSSIADLITVRLGPAFLERLVRPVVTGVHGSDPENLSVEAVMPTLVEALRATGSIIGATSQVRRSAKRPGAAVRSLTGGMVTLIDALVQDVLEAGVEIRYGQAVLGVTHQLDSWTVQTDSQDLLSQKLSLADGGTLLASLQISGESAERGSSSSSTAVGLVFAHVSSKQLNDFPLGTGGLIRPDSGWQAKATTHLNAKWGWIQDLLPKNEHLIRFSFGRNGVVPEGLSEMASSELAAIYAVGDAAVLETKEVLWPNSIVRLSGSAQSRAKLPHLEVCGAYVAGNGLLGIVKDHYERKAA